MITANEFSDQCSHRRTLLEVVQKFIQAVKPHQSSEHGKYQFMSFRCVQKIWICILFLAKICKFVLESLSFGVLRFQTFLRVEVLYTSKSKLTIR